MRSHAFLACLMFWTSLALAQAEPPETTEDGLVRVPSTVRAGVYRLPVASFHQYRRIEMGQFNVVFKRGWEREHRKELTKADIADIRARLVRSLRDELLKELAVRGGYALTDKPAPDVLRVEASILDTEITAPKASAAHMQTTFIKTAGSMKVIVELKDSISNVVVARIISYERAPESREPKPASQISVYADLRLGFENSARYAHEAISVAKSAKREDQSVIQTEN